MVTQATLAATVAQAVASMPAEGAKRRRLTGEHSSAQVARSGRCGGRPWLGNPQRWRLTPTNARRIGEASHPGPKEKTTKKTRRGKCSGNDATRQRQSTAENRGVRQKRLRQIRDLDRTSGLRKAKQKKPHPKVEAATDWQMVLVTFVVTLAIGMAQFLNVWLPPLQRALGELPAGPRVAALVAAAMPTGNIFQLLRSPYIRPGLEWGRSIEELSLAIPTFILRSPATSVLAHGFYTVTHFGSWQPSFLLFVGLLPPPGHSTFGTSSTWPATLAYTFSALAMLSRCLSRCRGTGPGPTPGAKAAKWVRSPTGRW
jgi:hypothetical protein